MRVKISLRNRVKKSNAELVIKNGKSKNDIVLAGIRLERMVEDQLRLRAYKLDERIS